MADREIRVSGRMLNVLKYLLSDLRKARSGADIFAATKVSSGTLYPMLVRLEEAGWLVSEWENIDPVKEGRPRRRYYSVTGLGQMKARAALDELQFGSDPAWQL